MKEICILDDLNFKRIEGMLAEIFEIYYISDDKIEHILGHAASEFGTRDIMNDSLDKKAYVRKLKVIYMDESYYLLQKMDLDNRDMLVKTNPKNYRILTQEEFDYIFSNIGQGPE